jgi:rhomboid protease GluP
MSQNDATEQALPGEPRPGSDGRRSDLPRAWATWLLVGANVLVYAAMAISTGSPFAFSTVDLLNWGGDFAPSVAEGEYWRPFTSMFLHAGIIHIGMNMWVLSAIGPFLERLFGATGFLLLYLLAGLAGNVFGMAFHPDIVGVGASGAIFGLYGGLLGFLFARRHVIPAEVLRPMVQNGLYFLGVNLVLGFSIANVDVAAHILGAFAGFVAIVVAGLPQLQNLRASLVVRNGLLAAQVVAVCAALPWCIPASAKAHAQFLQAVRHVGDQKQVLRDRFNALDATGLQESDPKAFAEKLDEEVLRPWSEMVQRFPPLEELPPRQQRQPQIMTIYRYLTTMQQALELLVEATRRGDEALAQQADAKFKEAGDLAGGSTVEQ